MSYHDNTDYKKLCESKRYNIYPSEEARNMPPEQRKRAYCLTLYRSKDENSWSFGTWHSLSYHIYEMTPEQYRTFLGNVKRNEPGYKKINDGVWVARGQSNHMEDKLVILLPNAKNLPKLETISTRTHFNYKPTIWNDQSFRSESEKTLKAKRAKIKLWEEMQAYIEELYAIAPFKKEKE